MKRKLHKSKTDKKICGVCSGIAESFGWDPTIIRIIWAVLVLGYGVGVVLYIACALIMPEE